MNKLYDKENGCQWIQEQSYETIAKYTIEEALEVVEAVKKKDCDNLKEELGDLLFQVIFYSCIAKNNNEFDFNDIVNELCNKLTRRNTHIFNNEVAKQYKKSLDKVTFASLEWQKAKRQEKN